MFPQIEKVPAAELDHLVTPYFMHSELVNQAKTENEQHIVTELTEVVQLRFAGDKNFSPVFPTDAMYRKDGVRVITYAERFADQYQQFIRGEAQEVAGTPLEKLADFGITPQQISLCRALKIYTVEALYNLDGKNLTSLGMSANVLKDMAGNFMADRNKGNAALDEIERLKAEIAQLRAAPDASTKLPANEAAPAEIEAAIAAADDEFAGMSDAQLKDEIAKFTGSRPQGNPNRTTLVQSLRELKAA